MKTYHTPEKEKQMEFYRMLGINIMSHRKRAKMSQEELAKQLGFSRVHICNVEAGKHQYSLYSLIRLCNVLKIDLTEVLPKITKESFKP